MMMVHTVGYIMLLLLMVDDTRTSVLTLLVQYLDLPQ